MTAVYFHSVTHVSSHCCLFLQLKIVPNFLPSAKQMMLFYRKNWKNKQSSSELRVGGRVYIREFAWPGVLHLILHYKLFNWKLLKVIKTPNVRWNKCNSVSSGLDEVGILWAGTLTSMKCSCQVSNLSFSSLLRLWFYSSSRKYAGLQNMVTCFWKYIKKNPSPKPGSSQGLHLV